MTFQGFGAQALPFLKALAFHQSKDWFEANRALYETEIKQPFGDLIDDLNAVLSKAGIPLMGDRRKSIFRLHRDTRFSKDKKPYKTNSGAVLNRDGTKGTGGMLYIHVELGRCFLGAGWYRPEPVQLAALRAAIAAKPKNVLAMERDLAAKGLRISDQDALKRTPKGFEAIADAAVLQAIRRKNLLVTRDIADVDIATPALVDHITAFAKDALPLLQFGWRAVG